MTDKSSSLKIHIPEGYFILGNVPDVSYVLGSSFFKQKTSLSMLDGAISPCHTNGNTNIAEIEGDHCSASAWWRRRNLLIAVVDGALGLQFGFWNI